MGKQACDTFVVFVAAQRLCMFAPTFVAAARPARGANVMRAFTENVALLFGLASLEMYTMTAYLMALDHLYVSYAIAAKRSGILLSVGGGAFFDEKIAKRLPYVLVILVGMTLVLLAGTTATTKRGRGGDNRRRGREATRGVSRSESKKEKLFLRRFIFKTSYHTSVSQVQYEKLRLTFQARKGSLGFLPREPPVSPLSAFRPALSLLPPRAVHRHADATRLTDERHRSGTG